MYNPSSLIRIANSFGHNSSSMNWLAPALSAGSSLLGSLFSVHSANKALKAQRQENALNRQFNAAEAQKLRDFQLDMFNRENAYNDPKAVVGRLMNAGMNPALAFGNIADSASVSGGSSASYGSGVNPPMPDWSGISAAGNAFLQQKLVQAQIDSIKANTRKTETEIPWIDQINSLNQEIGRLGIRLSEADLGIKGELKKNLAAERSNLKQSLENLKQELENLKQVHDIGDKQIEALKYDNECKRISAAYAERFSKAQLDSLIAETKQRLGAARLSNAQAVQLAGLYTFVIKKAQYDADISEYNASIAEDNAYMVNFSRDQLQGVLASTPWEEVLGWKKDEIIASIKALQSQGDGKDVEWLSALLGLGMFALTFAPGSGVVKGIKALRGVKLGGSTPPPPPYIP